MTEFYYKDLNNKVKAKFKKFVEQEGRKDLLKAIENGTDIIMGDLFDLKYIAVVESGDDD